MENDIVIPSRSGVPSKYCIRFVFANKIYLAQSNFIDKRAVNLIHPDLGSTGGILETKRIVDYGAEQGVAANLHYAGSPLGMLASVHAAAACEYIGVLEHHSVDEPDFDNLITGIEKPLVQNGYIPVPESPGLGAEPNYDMLEKYLAEGEELFAPTSEWDQINSWDRLWS